MKGFMKAAVLHKPLDLRVEDVEIPKIEPDQVLIRMKRVGICGSDIHYYLRGRISSYVVEKPLILGHECAGEIAEVGDEVKSFRVGQRVVVEPGFTCGKCEHCRSGRYNLCEQVNFYGTPPFNGAFAEYNYAPEQNVYPIPDTMSLEEGAMIEPLAVGMMAAKMGRVEAGDIVVILGAGPIGQMALQASKICGASAIFVSDLIEYRLEYAEKHGASAVINPVKEDLSEKVAKLTSGKGADVVIEASGAPAAIQQTVEIVKPGGTVVLVGNPHGEIMMPMSKIVSKEVRIQGIHRYANVYEAAIKAVSSGKAIVKPYVTHIFPLERIREAFEVHINKAGNPIKIQVAI
ncbi:MAG: NAD(P)-dependent alcohol dehydrogenase [Nitrososphaerota archaeon]|nr:NAD(P)-dependent alcohol dehydrogenase [Candidatus Bathyarchaeota archaeon]MDW8048935.1 NAD(P)-dependent alcohol dehydrogenase [Nitrososphaerota archaeon]